MNLSKWTKKDQELFIAYWKYAAAGLEIPPKCREAYCKSYVMDYNKELKEGKNQGQADMKKR